MSATVTLVITMSKPSYDGSFENQVHREPFTKKSKCVYIDKESGERRIRWMESMEMRSTWIWRNKAWHPHQESLTAAKQRESRGTSQETKQLITEMMKRRR